MKKLILAGVVLVVVLAVGVFLAYRLGTEGISIYVSEAELQERLEPHFPIERQILVLQTALTDPRVTLREGSDRMNFRVNVSASIPTQKPFSGAGEISGGIRYAPDTGQFFLTDSRIEELDIAAIPERYRDQVREVTSSIASEILERRPIYTLDATDVQEHVTRYLLDSVTVSDGRLRIVLALRPLTIDPITPAQPQPPEVTE